MRFSAWLNAAPERPRIESGSSKIPKEPAPRVTRLERMRQDRDDPDYLPEMPPIDGGEHLIAYLWEIGPTVGGSSVIAHSEIRAWQENVGVELEAWEARMLRNLSSVYLDETLRAENHDRASPWEFDQSGSSNLKAVARNMQQSLRTLASL